MREKGVQLSHSMFCSTFASRSPSSTFVHSILNVLPTLLKSETKIIKMLNETKEMEWQKSTSEHVYLQMTSSSELMKKAAEMKISVITSDKVVQFD